MRERLRFVYALFYILLLIGGIADIMQRIAQEGGLLDVIAAKVGWIVDFGLLHPLALLPTAAGAWLVGYLWFSGAIDPSRKTGLWAGALNVLLILMGAHFLLGLLRQYLF